MERERFAFWGGEIVAFLHDKPKDGIRVGDPGWVWGVYDLNPPVYEATFTTGDGDEIDVMFQADEVYLVAQAPEVDATPD